MFQTKIEDVRVRIAIWFVYER